MECNVMSSLYYRHGLDNNNEIAIGEHMVYSLGRFLTIL
jgi:hypothetical protein